MTSPAPAIRSNPPLAAAKHLSLAVLAGLILLYITTRLLDERMLWTILLVPCFSLMIFVPGMVKNRPRSFDWLCFVILIHFTVGVTGSMSPLAAWNDYLQTLLTVVLFISAMMTSRWLKATQRQGLSETQPQTQSQASSQPLSKD